MDKLRLVLSKMICCSIAKVVHRNTYRSSRYLRLVKFRSICHRNMSAKGGYQGNVVNGIGADVVVDLRSDTVTKPGKGMREAIANAIVGDDVFDEDPTTKEFEQRVANLFGKEEALVVSSGTQGNLICALVHCNERGSEMICGDQTHMFMYEQGNVSQFGGIHSSQIKNEIDGTFSLETLEQKIRSDDIHYPITKLVCVENTHNRCGGRVLPLEWLDKLAEICRRHGNIPIHMDGARIFNASVASGVEVKRIVRDMSSLSICLSKGLGAPLGSVIVGSKDFIRKARRMRKALGGGMRQMGIISAAGIYCLDNMITRLKEDHDNAKRLADLVNGSEYKDVVHIDTELLQSNIIVLHVKGLNIIEFCAALASVEDVGGRTVAVRCFPWSATAVRLVTHCDVDREMVELAANKISHVASKINL